MDGVRQKCTAMGVVRGSVSIAPPDLSERWNARANNLAMVLTGMRHFRH
jgi:AICAR transformylase/IMP cyclohydrolase PurH